MSLAATASFRALRGSRGLHGRAIPPEDMLLAWCIRRLSGTGEPAPGHPTSLNAAGWRRLARLAQWHRLEPVLLYVLKQDGSLSELPRSVVEPLEKTSRSAVAQQLLLTGHLRQILDALRGNGMPVIVLKGMPLTQSLYPQVGLRPTADIDLLVRTTDIPGAERTLESLDFAATSDQGVRDMFKSSHHHLAPYLHRRTRTMVEVHWQVVRPDRPHQLDVQELWENAREASFQGIPFLMLDPEDQLIHLGLHFMGDRVGARPGALLQLCDISLLMSRSATPLRWDTVVERCVRQSVGDPVYMALLAAATVAGAPCPEEVYARLRPDGFDDEAAGLFIMHRVFGTDRRVPYRFVESLAVAGLPGKVRRLTRALRATPPAFGGVSERRRPGLGRFVLEPFVSAWRVLAAVGQLTLHWADLRGEMRTEEWLARHFSSVDRSGRE